jgi:asparagine synthase (glutamine-hydrolysing)
MLGVPRKEELASIKKEIPKEYSLEALEKAFIKSIEENTANVKRCAVLFSGGLDSSTIAFAIAKKVRETTLYCCGFPHSKALERAAKAASLLGLDLKKVIVDDDTLKEAVSEVVDIIGSQDIVHVQIGVPEYLCLRAIKEDSFNVAFTGQGADELFAGYDEFRRVFPQKGFSGARDVLWRRILNIYQDNIDRDSAIAEHFGIELRAPFLHKEFMLQALAFPIEKNLLGKDDFLRKHVLRRLAEHMGVPKELCYERKKAIQYDSGIAKHIRKILASSKPHRSH